MEQAIKKANNYIATNKHKVNPEFRNQYHMMAPIGWINDPNGFIFYEGEYHLFYQFYPYDSVWGPMHWGHATSVDLVNWDEKPVALAPSESYDKDGCFSGSAIEKDGALYLFYTGHVDNNGEVEQVQCLATSKDGIHFEKYVNNPVINQSHIDNIASTNDFRDPKVFKRNGIYYMVVAAKTNDLRGQILLFESTNLLEWSFKSVLLEGKPDQGIMWECPDLIEIDGKDVLLMSPIQFKEKDENFKNLNSTVAFVGTVDWESGKLKVDHYHEIDNGIDFYAPQTCTNEKNEIILVAWMQMWARNMPSNDLNHGWAGSMTLPRKVSLVDGFLAQRPADEVYKRIIDLIREKKEEIQTKKMLASQVKDNDYYKLDIDLKEATQLTFLYNRDNGQCIKFMFDKKTGLFSFTRDNYGYAIKGEEKPILNTRSLKVNNNNNQLTLEIFRDTSSMEIFINETQTMSSTFFDNHKEGEFTLETNSPIELVNYVRGFIA